MVVPRNVLARCHFIASLGRAAEKKRSAIFVELTKIESEQSKRDKSKQKEDQNENYYPLRFNLPLTHFLRGSRPQKIKAGTTNKNKPVSFTAIACQGFCQIKEEQGEKEYGIDT